MGIGPIALHPTKPGESASTVSFVTVIMQQPIKPILVAASSSPEVGRWVRQSTDYTGPVDWKSDWTGVDAGTWERRPKSEQ